MRPARTILHVITSIEPGGAEHHLLSLAKAQVEQGDQVTVAYLKESFRNLRSQLNEAGISVVSLGLTWYGQIAPIKALRTLIQQREPDLIHAHLPPAELYARLALIGRSKKAFVISKHNDERFAPVPLPNRLASWVAGRAEKVICISKAVEKYWLDASVISKKQSELVYYGMEPAQNPDGSQFRGHLGVRSEAVLFGFVGRLVPQKAVENLIAAFASLKAPNAHLAIVGDGPLEKKLREKVIALGVGEKVSFTGYRDDIPTVMAGIDVLVLGSNYEGFGLVLLEAMNAGKPILATRVSAIPEVVEDETTGILVPPRDPQKMMEGMSRMMCKKTRQEMGNAALALFDGSFGIDRMVEQTQQVYDRALSGCVA